MPVLTSPPLIGGAGKPVTGRVAISVTAEYKWDGKLVTTTPQAGVVRGGQFYDLDSNDPLTIPATPEGVGLRIVLHLDEQGAARGEHRVSRVVAVPDVATVAWDDLVDVIPPVTGDDYIVPPWAREMLKDAAVTVTEGTAWGATVDAADGIARFRFTVPPGGTAWNRGVLASGANLDEATSDGVVRADTGTAAKTIVNRPAGFDQPFEVTVRRLSTVNNILVQEARMKVAGVFKLMAVERVGFGGVWGPWQPVRGVRADTAGGVLAVLGDSQSATPAWVDQMQPLVSSPLLNVSRSGDDSNTVAIRSGALSVRGTVTGESIPASGSVTFTSKQKLQLRTNRIIDVGTLGGVTGTLRHDANDVYTFTRSIAGAATPAAGVQEFRSSFTTDAATVLVWMGGNDFNQGVVGLDGTTATHTLANYYRVVEHFEGQGAAVLVVGVTSRGTTPPGSSGFAQIQRVNDSLAARYPGRFIDVQGYLSSQALAHAGLTPTAADTAAMAAGDVPPQLQIEDRVHLTPLAHDTLATRMMLPWLATHGYVTPTGATAAVPVQSPKGADAAMAAYLAA